MKTFTSIGKYLLAFFTISLCYATSCDQDLCENRTSQPLHAALLGAIPYQQGDLVRFENSSGTSITLNTEREFTVNTPDSPPVCEEVLEIRMTKPDGTLYIEILSRGSINSDQIQLTLFDEAVAGPIVQFAVLANNQLGKAAGVDGTAIFHDSIEIDGQIYEDVLQLDYPEIQEDWIRQLYYNRSTGIISLITYNGYSLQRL